jgi:ABC-type branched-subunit amino acid transport system ATPase component
LARSLATAYAAYPVLAEKRGDLAGTLSGGQQRLLSLAKVLVVPPKILVADELCLGLAPLVVDAVYDALRAMNQNGTALLVVEQQVDRVLDIADRAVILEHGSVVYDGEPAGATQAMEQVLRTRGERPVSLGGDCPDELRASVPASTGDLSGARETRSVGHNGASA